MFHVGDTSEGSYPRIASISASRATCGGHSRECRHRSSGPHALVTSILPFEEWTEIFGSEGLARALLDREVSPHRFAPVHPITVDD